MLNIFGTATSAVAPVIMGAFTRAEINPFILFAVLGLLGITCYIVCPETFGKLCPEEIEEIQFEKNKISAI